LPRRKGNLLPGVLELLRCLKSRPHLVRTAKARALRGLALFRIWGLRR
jgi:hypothetical protein